VLRYQFIGTILRIFSRHRLLQLVVCTSVLSLPVFADETTVSAKLVQLEELTSTEVRDRVIAGSTTILIPIGATEQTGPYVALGKHNFRVHALADQIAQKLGNTLVAPVISYVPEGAISPPVAHMRFTGTISIPDAAFEAMLEGAARSFKQHGFKHIVLLGDHGGYKQNMERVAKKLNQEWNKDPRARVIYLSEYYRLSSAGVDALLKKRGYSDAEIGAHGGLSDTALTMAIDKNLVRSDAMTAAPKPMPGEGITGDPRRATAELGQVGVQLIVDGSVAALRTAIKNEQ
jgi:creatinine amidohydrolase